MTKDISLYNQITLKIYKLEELVELTIKHLDSKWLQTQNDPDILHLLFK